MCGAGRLSMPAILGGETPRNRAVHLASAGDYARTVTSEPFDTALFRERIQSVLDDFVDEQSVRLTPLGPDAAALVAEAHRSVTGGKRFRAAFC